MLKNLDQYEKLVPGFSEQTREIANDPVKWKAAMFEARDQLLKLKKERDAKKGGAQTPDDANNRYLFSILNHL